VTARHFQRTTSFLMMFSPQEVPVVAPKSKPAHAGEVWKALVERTAQHPRFNSTARAEGAEWIRARKHGAWCKDLPHGEDPSCGGLSAAEGANGSQGRSETSLDEQCTQ
jgi:hypothetical protein